ncbi:S41 family peptidase [Aquimarina sp. 2201CG5-10]|uniref:S41 family peptidase n=1 Tax=Aquimarina callyspongiae TaxID=3098150 RepID=UPI002AB4A40C|nr:S41 family peptidase [Aquimarina sp. 2201CG5-10]MDY8135869.1 S41 family peptidase [Aquimarina sp. 2201CG5-10]
MKKTALVKTVLVLTCFLFSVSSFAQSNNDIVKKVQNLLVENYIFLDKAEETNKHLDKLMKQDYFDNMSASDFAETLTKELRKITKDKHLRVSSSSPKKKEKKSDKSFTEDLSRYRAPMLRGFQLMESNIGYIDLAFFGGADIHRSKIDMVMKEMEKADAIIIDMRRNGGGSPHTVNYLSSYFFNEKILLNTIYSRADNHSEEMWVVDVDGVKRPEVPVYILTSSYTFSGAEDFSYTMQSRKRAVVIGEITGGGAHPTRFYPLEKGFGIGIPFARTVNTVTKTNWEGTGVQPDIKRKADDALEEAKILAKKTSQDYKKSLFDPLKNALTSVKEEKNIHKQLNLLVQSKILNEGEINILGYSYLQRNEVGVALAIFKSNTLLFPDSANVFDSYAEGLAKNKQDELALLNYKKAVDVATKHKDRQLEIFKNNLKAFKEKK